MEAAYRRSGKLPEFQKLYGETYGPHASEIIRAANRRAGSGVDASVSGNLLNRAHLEKIIDALHQTMKAPGRCRSGESMSTALTIPASSNLPLPTLIGRAGKPAARRFIEFFTVNIRNKNTRQAYGRAAAQFLSWCEGQGIGELAFIQPIHVAAYVEQLQRECSAPTVKQHLACLRMLFDWLVTGQVMPANPAHSVRGPRHSVSKGATPVISSAEARELLDSMDIETLVGLRDRAIVAVMAFTFGRVTAVVNLNVEDYYAQKKRWWLRFHEKNGKVNEMPCHHKLEAISMPT